ncbi:MBL fold metallo-hydrolase [Alloiococcus sp. CFN-8]|uniref:MBL fold metallo-hydrolase n=1 Tax=Alloiococcus sp. CFN-8 TaxID=3416081 RepID=UPI003CF7E57A
MIVKTIPAGMYAANCYLIYNEITMDALVLDPGGDEDFIIKNIDRLNLNVKAILLTHGHMDHVGALKAIADRYKVMTYINKKDIEYMKKGSPVFGKFLDIVVTFVEDNEVINIAGFQVQCIWTPGHTPGGMCFLIEDSLFAGDTLFQGSIGRTDFEGGDYDTIINSIVEKLMILEDNVIVYPGHGEATTIIQERNYNPFIN